MERAWKTISDTHNGRNTSPVLAGCRGAPRAESRNTGIRGEWYELGGGGGGHAGT